MFSKASTVISPLIRAAIRFFLSKTKVVGIAFGIKDPLKPSKIESSIKVGYGMAKRRAKASAVAAR